MKNPAVVVLVLLALGVALFLATRRKEASGAKFRSTDEFIQFMATEAAKDAGGKERIDLDYSVNSIKGLKKFWVASMSSMRRTLPPLVQKGLGQLMVPTLVK